MRKNLIVAMLLGICLMIGITGCESTKTTNNEGSIPYFSTAPSTVLSTQQINSSDSMGAIMDYNQFIRKVWVLYNETKEVYNYSFCISKIENEKIEGKFSLSISVPDNDYYTQNDSGYLGELIGTVKDGVAECKFNNRNGDKANIQLVFQSNNQIEAIIQYTEKSENNKDKFLDGTFLFRPYNLKDIEGFEPFEDHCFSVDLNSWGKVKFVSGKITGGLHIPTVAYLTTLEDDILFDFTSAIPNNVDLIAVPIQDVNKDGLKDIIMIYGAIEGDCAAVIFTQNTDGVFSVAVEMSSLF